MGSPNVPSGLSATWPPRPPPLKLFLLGLHLVGLRLGLGRFTLGLHVGTDAAGLTADLGAQATASAVVS